MTDKLDRAQWTLIQEQAGQKVYLPERSRKGKTILSFIILVLAIFLYISADINCPYPSDPQCADDFIIPSLVSWIIHFGISAILFSLLILLGFSYNKVPRATSILAVLSVIYLTYFHRRSNEHGDYPIVRDSNQFFL